MIEIEKKIIREFNCQVCGKLVQIVDKNDKRTKNCSKKCMTKSLNDRHKAKYKRIPKTKPLVSQTRKVIKEDNSNLYYFIENGVKFRCSENGYKKRELFDDKLLSKKGKGWSESDYIELVGLKLGKLHKDKDIALLLERPISAIRHRFYLLKKQGKISLYLEKFKKGVTINE